MGQEREPEPAGSINDRIVARAKWLGRRTLWRVRHRVRHRKEQPEQAWSNGLAEEVEFWRDWFRTCGLQWPDEYRRRLDPLLPLQDHIARYINVPQGSVVRILDVGAGPLTSLGKNHPDFDLTIQATDVLADEYAKLITEANIDPPIRTVHAETERLSEFFPGEQFDVVHARNTLDHSYDPLRAIREMAAATKHGGAVMLQHRSNEAEFEEYQGLHQWNLSIDNGRFLVARPTGLLGNESHDVAVELADILELVSIARVPDTPGMDFIVFLRR